MEALKPLGNIVAVAGCLILATSLHAQSFKVLHTFTNAADGAVPNGGLVLSNVWLYGTTRQGGSSGKGTLYRARTDGTEYVVKVNFGSSIGEDPNGELVRTNNTFYLTTKSGGAYTNGVIFQFLDSGNTSSYGALSSLNKTSGIEFNGGLVLNGSTLYGTTFGYPVPVAAPGGDTAYKYVVSGSGFSVLTNLTGKNPNGGLLLSGNNLFGTSAAEGTIFKVDVNTGSYSVIKTLANSEGASLNGNLVLSGGMLYGTAYSGGTASKGTLFKVGTDGLGFTVLKNFPALQSNTNSDGATPVGGLVQSGSTLFGVASTGGSSGNGVIFKISTNGNDFAALYHFPKAIFNPLTGKGSNIDGATPNGNLLMVSGTLYGTTSMGGTAGQGVLYRFIIPPEIQTDDGKFGILTNRFGFTIKGISNQTVVVESCTNLGSTNWTTRLTTALGAAPLYFTDSQWTNSVQQFYRIRVQ